MRGRILLCIVFIAAFNFFIFAKADAMAFSSNGYVFNAVNETAVEVLADGTAKKSYKKFSPIPVASLDGAELSFVPLFDKECLKLVSRDGAHDYLSFAVKEGEQVLVQELVGRDSFDDKEIVRCWAVLTKNYKSGNVNNFWLVGGPVKNTYVTYVSLDTLKSYGFPCADLRLDLKYSAILLRGGARFIVPEDKNKPPVSVDAAVMELFWDEGNAWFGVKRII